MSDQEQRRLTHLDDQGRASMVDTGSKPPMHRRAVAEGFFVASPGTIDLVMGDAGAGLPKGDALAVARIAGIQGAKRTGDLIPLCHPLPLEFAGVEFERTAPDRIRVVGTASITARTGIEMEALTAVSIAALTLYDMTKAVDRNLRIEDVRLVEKTKTPVDG